MRFFLFVLLSILPSVGCQLLPQVDYTVDQTLTGPTTSMFDGVDVNSVGYTVPTMCSAITANGNPLGLVELELAINYPTTDGIVAVLADPNNNDAYTLINCPGTPDESSTPVPTYGSEMVSSSPIVISEQGWTKGEILGYSGPVVCQDDGNCHFKPSPQSQSGYSEGPWANSPTSLDNLISATSTSLLVCVQSRDPITTNTSRVAGNFTPTLRTHSVTTTDIDVSVSLPVGPINGSSFSFTANVDPGAGGINGEVTCYIQAGSASAISHIFTTTSFTCSVPTAMDPIVCVASSLGSAEDIEVNVTFSRRFVTNSGNSYSFDVQAVCVPSSAPYYNSGTSNADEDSVQVQYTTTPDLGPFTLGTGVPIQVTRNYRGWYPDEEPSVQCLSTLVDQNGTLTDILVEAEVESVDIIGRVVLKVITPTGKTATLMLLPGVREATDGIGTLGVGTASQMDDTFAFSEGFGLSAEWAGWDNNDFYEEASGVGGRKNYYASPGAAADTGLSNLIGEHTAGNWKVCLGLYNGGETYLSNNAELGSFNEARVYMTATDISTPSFTPTEQVDTCTAYVLVYSGSPCEQSTYTGCVALEDVQDGDCVALSSSIFGEINCNPLAGYSKYIKVGSQCFYGNTAVFEETCTLVDSLYFSVTYDAMDGCSPPGGITSGGAPVNSEDSGAARLLPQRVEL